eukprot:3562542-Prymnesium_polylepis.1
MAKAPTIEACAASWPLHHQSWGGWEGLEAAPPPARSAPCVLARPWPPGLPLQGGSPVKTPRPS